MDSRNPNHRTPPPPSAAPSKDRVSQHTVRRAVNALLKWKTLQSSQTPNPNLLDPQDDFIYLLLTLKKIPPKDLTTNPNKILVPHPLHSLSPSSEICLIIDDRSKSNSKHSKLTSDASKKKIKSENIPITKVIKLSKLKSDYRSFEAKRNLFDSFDIFFADKRVIPLLPKLLGKQFYKKKKKKIPLPVDLIRNNWKEQIERAFSSVLLCLSTGTCSVVRIGRISMESGEIVENVVAAIDGVVEVLPKKWAGVRSFHLKFSESLALPIYQALPDLMWKIEGRKKNRELEVKDINDKDDKKGLKKGKICEVRYIDAEVNKDELLVEDDNGSDNSEDNELGTFEFSGKNRKEGDSAMIRVKMATETRNDGTVKVIGS